MTGPSSWIGRLVDPASACLDSDSDFVENTTYHDLFDSIDGTTLGIVKVAAAFMKMHGHVGVFIVETRERRGEQAVLAFFTNIEELRLRPDKVVPANDGRLGTGTTRMPRPLTYRCKGGSDTLHVKFDGHGWTLNSSSDESKKVLQVRFRHVGLVHRVIGFGSVGRRRDRPDVRQQPDGSEGQGQGQGS